MRALWLAIAVAGCGASKSEPAAPRGPAPCERVGDHLVGLMTAGFQGTPEERPTEAIDKLTRVLVELCEQGRWSTDAQQCFLEVGALVDADRCAGLLTVEQRDAFPRAIDGAFGAPGARPGAQSGTPPAEAAPPTAAPRQAPPSDPCEGGE